jgi:mannosyltransferase
MVFLLQKRIWIVPFALFVLNIILKIMYLSANGIALDEPFSIFYAQLSLRQLVPYLFSGNNPPLFEILLHFWIRIFGIGVFSVRFLPLLFSSVTAIYVFLLGRKISGISTGITAALLFTFSSFHIYFSHEARTYSLFALLSACSMYYYFSLNEKSQGLTFFLFLLSNLLLVFSHYFGLLVVLVELFFAIVFRKTYPLSFRKVWVSCLLLSVLISPLLYFLSTRLGATVHEGGTWVTAPPFDALYENIRKFSNAPVIAVLLLLISITGSTFIIWKKLYKTDRFLLVLPIWFFGIYSGVFLISFLLPCFLDRYLIFLSIPFYLLVAVSVKLIIGQRFGFFPEFCCCMAMLLSTNLNPGNERDPVGLGTFIVQHRFSGTIVFISPAWADKGILYYCNNKIFRDVLHFKERLAEENWFSVYTTDEAFSKIPDGTQRILFIEDGRPFLDTPGTKFLSPSFPFQLSESKQFGKADWVRVYDRKSTP